jgi:hypothetical protein
MEYSRPGSTAATHTSKPAPLEVVDQQRQCPIEDRADVSVRRRMSGKRLRAPQFFVRLTRQRYLPLVAFRREWRHDGRTELRRCRRSDVMPTRRTRRSDSCGRCRQCLKRRRTLEGLR